MRQIKHFNRQKRLDLIREMPKTLLDAERRNVDIKDVGAGGYVTVNNDTYYVSDINRYEEGNKKWFELVIVSLTTGNLVFLEWEIDDVLEVYLYDENLTLRQLGTTPGDLQVMDDDEDENCEYSLCVRESLTVYYEDSDEATFFKSNGSQGEKYYYWDFYDESKQHCLGIECWGDEYEACLGINVNTNNIEVLVKGGAN